MIMVVNLVMFSVQTRKNLASELCWATACRQRIHLVRRAMFDSRKQFRSFPVQMLFCLPKALIKRNLLERGPLQYLEEPCGSACYPRLDG